MSLLRSFRVGVDPIYRHVAPTALGFRRGPRYVGTGDALRSNMRIPHFHLPKFDLLGFKTGLELAAGGVLTAALMRWLAI